MELSKFTASEHDIGRHYARRQPNKETRRTVRKSFDLPRHSNGERFVRGPIPLEWLKRASKCGNRADGVSLLLWYAAGWQKTNPVKLTSSILQELGIHPKTAKRVLQKMESLGLVRNEFKRGRSPMVTLTDPQNVSENRCTECTVTNKEDAT